MKVKEYVPDLITNFRKKMWRPQQNSGEILTATSFQADMTPLEAFSSRSWVLALLCHALSWVRWGCTAIVVILTNPSKAFHFPLALFSTLAISCSIPHPFASARFPSTLLLFSCLPDHASDLWSYFPSMIHIPSTPFAFLTLASPNLWFPSSKKNEWKVNTVGPHYYNAFLERYNRE